MLGAMDWMQLTVSAEDLSQTRVKPVEWAQAIAEVLETAQRLRP